jgi:hypothetical protein
MTGRSGDGAAGVPCNREVMGSAAVPVGPARRPRPAPRAAPARPCSAAAGPACPGRRRAPARCLSQRTWRRLEAALAAVRTGRAAYLQDGYRQP